jgi:hypothetical protein
MAKTKKERPYPDKIIIKGALRRVMARSPIIRFVLDRAVHPYKKGVRGGKQYICRCCKEAFPANRVAVDHIEPVVPTNRSLESMDYNELVSRIFCLANNLQVICDVCHKTKTKAEMELRKQERLTRKDVKEILADVKDEFG